jgi:arylsulfatase A-like enzyme
MPAQSPNILLILTDQQAAGMMSCAGNRHVRTPAMDSLAAGGMRFQRAYCCNPMCGPSRFALMTGRLAGEIGMRNHDNRLIQSIPDSLLEGSLGSALRRAGYATYYGGKHHLPKGLTPVDLGFEVISTDERDALADKCSAFLLEPRESPFFLVASFINPHDICYMAIRDFASTPGEHGILANGAEELATLDHAMQLPEGMDEVEFYADVCPPLPQNYEIQIDEPEAIRQMQARSPFKGKARAQWDERRWRLHRWAYARLTEHVDAQIGRVVDALEASGQAENTLVVFTSDHGDMDASHRMEHKTAFYEEAAHVPFVMRLPGVIPAGTVSSHLVSNGLDLLPTLCDFGGAEARAELPGLSLRPLAEGNAPRQRREALPVESEMGRMIVTDRYKYMLYDDGQHREQLIDLVADPGETRNALADTGNELLLETMRALMAETFRA